MLHAALICRLCLIDWFIHVFVNNNICWCLFDSVYLLCLMHLSRVYMSSRTVCACLYWILFFWFSVSPLCSWAPHLPCISLVSIALLPESSPANQLQACSSILPPVPCCCISSVCAKVLFFYFSLIRSIDCCVYSVLFIQLCFTCTWANIKKLLYGFLHWGLPAPLHITLNCLREGISTLTLTLRD